MAITITDQISLFRFERQHGRSVLAAADKAGLDYDEAMRLEGKHYCAMCGDYVRQEDCAHWDYES